MNETEPNEFEKAGAKETNRSLVGEIWGLLKANKKWWQLPIVIVLLIFGLLILLSATGLAPLIYTLF